MAAIARLVVLLYARIAHFTYQFKGDISQPRRLVLAVVLVYSAVVLVAAAVAHGDVLQVAEVVGNGEELQLCVLVGVSIHDEGAVVLTSCFALVV